MGTALESFLQNAEKPETPDKDCSGLPATAKRDESGQLRGSPPFAAQFSPDGVLSWTWPSPGIGHLQSPSKDSAQRMHPREIPAAKDTYVEETTASRGPSHVRMVDNDQQALKINAN